MKNTEVQKISYLQSIDKWCALYQDGTENIISETEAKAMINANNFVEYNAFRWAKD